MSTKSHHPFVRLVRPVYNRLRRRLPRTHRVLNGVAVPNGRYLDLTTNEPEYERAYLGALRNSVDLSDTVVIIGGGTGASAVVAARNAVEGRVFVYEAARDKVELARETAALNVVADRIDAEHAVVGEAVKTWGAIDGADSVAPTDLPDCDVLALDCEGAEVGILESLEIRPRRIIVETHGHYGAPPNDVADLLSSHGYEILEEDWQDRMDGEVIYTAEMT